MIYQNLDIWIEKLDTNRYSVKAKHEDFGTEKVEMKLDHDGPDIKSFKTVIALDDVDSEVVSGYGAFLFKKLFLSGDGRINELYNRCLGGIQKTKDQGIRIRLIISPPEIAALPWEFMYRRSSGFLCKSIQTPVVRYLELSSSIRNFQAKQPLKMLVVIPDNPDLKIDEEKSIIDHSISGVKDIIHPVFLEGTISLDRIDNELKQGDFHILHFVGHGSFHDEQPFIHLHNDNGETEFVNPKRFAGILYNEKSLKLVVLNSCNGASVSSNNSMVGMSPQLVSEGIPAVVAMQYEIKDSAAITFSKNFYNSLFGIEYPGSVETAMSLARNKLFVDYPDDLSIGIPVLFMRAKDGVLFLYDKEKKEKPQLSKKYATRVTTKIRATESNIALLEYEHNNIAELDVEDELVKQKRELLYLKKRLKIRSHSIKAILVSILILISAASVDFFDLFKMDTFMESVTMRIGNIFKSHAYSEDIYVLTFDDTTIAYFESPYDTVMDRKDHARLIDSLSKYGTSVIALDVYFDTRNQSDSLLSEAIKLANSRGSRVIIGFNELEDGVPVTIDPLKNITRQGLLCKGQKLGFANISPLMKLKDDFRYPSFALETYAAWKNAEIGDANLFHKMVDVEMKTETDRIHFTEVELVSSVQEKCPSIGIGDTLTNTIVYQVPDEKIEDQVISYITPFIDNNWSRFENKIVMVGWGQKGKDEFETFEGIRAGVQLHADVVNMLIQKICIRPAGLLSQFLITVILSFLGGFLRLRKPGVNVKVKNKWLTLSVITYLVIVIFVYVEFNILLNLVYHVLAMIIAYIIAGKIEKKYL